MTSSGGVADLGIVAVKAKKQILRFAKDDKQKKDPHHGVLSPYHLPP
jgi:hypothetical protein